MEDLRKIMLSFKVSEAEQRQIDALAVKLSMRRSEYLRSVALPKKAGK